MLPGSLHPEASGEGQAVIGTVRHKSARLLLWLLALAALCFSASLFPEGRRRLPFAAPEPTPDERG